MQEKDAKKAFVLLPTKVRTKPFPFFPQVKKAEQFLLCAESWIKGINYYGQTSTTENWYISIKRPVFNGYSLSKRLNQIRTLLCTICQILRYKLSLAFDGSKWNNEYCSVKINWLLINSQPLSWYLKSQGDGFVCEAAKITQDQSNLPGHIKWKSCLEGHRDLSPWSLRGQSYLPVEHVSTCADVWHLYLSKCSFQNSFALLLFSFPKLCVRFLRFVHFKLFVANKTHSFSTLLKSFNKMARWNPSEPW